MPRNTYEALAGLNFVVDYSSIQIGPGCQIDWDLIPDSYRAGAAKVKLSADAAIGADELAVDALPVDLPLDTYLKFGEWAPVTVTLNDASVSAGDTSITVVALPGPLPAGAVINFDGGTNAQVAVTSQAHAAGLTTLTVEKLDGTIANSSTGLFAGGTIGARVTAKADKGDTTVAVDELQFAIANDAEASVDGAAGRGAKFIPAGTVMARLASKKVVPRAIRPGSETAVCLLASNASNEDKNVGYTGYGEIIGGSVYENLLPEQSGGTINGTHKTELNAAGVGTGFAFRQYSDSRES